MTQLALVGAPDWWARFEEAVRRIFGDASAVHGLELPLSALGTIAGRWLGETLDRPRVPSAAPHLRAILTGRQAPFVGVDQATADGIRELVRRHLATGGSPEQIATLIRYRVGLTPGQQAAVDALRQRLQRAPGGLSETALQQAVADYALKLRTLRARTIATTEAGRIWNGVAYDLMVDLDLPAHIWWTRRDEFVRLSHRGLHGTCRATGEVWITIWRNALRFPHDPEAPPEEVINCRCVALPQARPCGKRPLGPLASLEARMAAAREADRHLDRGIARTTDALGAAFWEQEQALERALRELGL